MRKSATLLLFLVAILAAMAAKGLVEQPAPLPTALSPGGFDAVRAKARLAYLLGDERPHPSDTSASDLVRTRLVSELARMGLNPIIRDQFSCNQLYKRRGVSCARTRNVIVVLGPSTGKAILLNAHYDSVPVGPGASDDGIGVATLLEDAAILKNRPLERPVILLFNDGEELGLIGARAFLSDPLSKDVDALINLEARGVRGPVSMFETSRPNVAPIRLFRKVRNPVANSLSTDVYRLLPNATDVNSLSERGWLTLNFAPIGNETRYHSAGDDLRALDLATLQQMGDQSLGLTEILDNGTPKNAGGDRIFMDVAGRWLIDLPLAVGAAVLIGLILAYGWIAYKRGGMLAGTAAVAGSALLATILSWLMLAVIGAIREGMFWRAHQIATNLAVYATAMLAAIVLTTGLAGNLDVRRLRASFWFIFLIIGGMIGLIASGGIVYFLFPPLIALAGEIAALRWKPAATAGSIAAVLVLFLTWGAMLGLLEELLNNGPMWLFAPLGLLLVFPALVEARPLFVAAGPRISVYTTTAVAFLCWTIVLTVPAYSADRQQRFVLQHVTDAARNRSWWSLINDGAPAPKDFGSNWKRDVLPIGDSPRWLARAPRDPEAIAPQVQLLSQDQSGSGRTLHVSLIAKGNESITLVAPPDARIRSAGAQGFVRPIDPEGQGKYYISCFGRACNGSTIQLTIDKPETVNFLVLGGRAPLPQSAASLLANRPPFARPQYTRDETIAFTHVNL